ncbi:hypothetical protein A1O1_00292 [Capronia coronata CBS 617.96]|uniref:Uncharacterized protein n=1 Tax=Capronia coronata CBS 617.96 TaxID=1182541 RepID=W9YRH9_9EURO|nr:uncharacterized protein A1O1_00292 [Capronia coronata CBS 617.96]EXJ95173.1 hypothetical protein A1O1_00292 [Capronia coronata CBS 617.96]
MPFILTNGISKPEPDKRKLIRRYVMLGKNQGKPRKNKPTTISSAHQLEDFGENRDESSGLLINVRHSTVLNKVGSEISFTHFAGTVEPSLIREVLKLCLMAKKVMYPLESCITFHRKSKVDTIWVELMAYDAAYMHAVVFSTQAYISRVSGGETPTATRRTLEHHSRTLRLLRERLSAENEAQKISDSTLLVVLYLARHAHFTNDNDSARHHMQGLRKIVDMRGGLRAFSYNQKLVMELLKCDLGIALNNGTQPMFSTDLPVEPLPHYDLAPSAAEQSDPSNSEHYWTLGTYVDATAIADLSRAWTVMTRFCSAINSAAEHKRRLPQETLLNTMTSVMYPLLNLHLERRSESDPTSVPDAEAEAGRLGLLAFSSHVFLRWQEVEAPQTYFPETYRSCLLHLRLGVGDTLTTTTTSTTSTSTPQFNFLLWLLVVGAISVFTPADDVWLMPWIRALVNLCGIREWNDLRARLKRLPWIDILHDKPGRKVFESAVSSTPRAETGSVQQIC